MTDQRATIHAMMRGLVARHFPSQSSAAKEIADFWHPTGNCGNDYDTADLSRKMNGTRRWTVDDVIAIQAIAGTDRVSQMMVPRNAAACSKLSLLDHASVLIKEGGEGVAALISAAEGGDTAKVRAELLDIVQAAQSAVADIDAESATATVPFNGVVG